MTEGLPTRRLIEEAALTEVRLGPLWELRRRRARSRNAWLPHSRTPLSQH